MGLVAVQLGAMVFVVHGVLDRQGVEPELFGEDLQVGGVGLTQVQPDHRPRLWEVVGDLGSREVLAALLLAVGVVTLGIGLFQA